MKSSHWKYKYAFYTFYFLLVLFIIKLVTINLLAVFDIIEIKKEHLFEYDFIIAFILTAGVVIAFITWLIIDYRERKNIERLNLMKDLLEKNQRRIQKLQDEVLREKCQILNRLERASTPDSELTREIDRQVEMVKEIKEILEKLIEVESREMESLLKQNEIMVRAISEIHPQEEE